MQCLVNAEKSLVISHEYVSKNSLIPQDLVEVLLHQQREGVAPVARAHYILRPFLPNLIQQGMEEQPSQRMADKHRTVKSAA